MGTYLWDEAKFWCLVRCYTCESLSSEISWNLRMCITCLYVNSGNIVKRYFSQPLICNLNAKRQISISFVQSNSRQRWREACTNDRQCNIAWKHFGYEAIKPRISCDKYSENKFRFHSLCRHTLLFMIWNYTINEKSY